MFDLSSSTFLFSFLIIGLVNFLAVISPGPDFAVLVKTALANSRSKSIFTALGIALGVLVHVSYCILGIAIIISKSILLFNFIKYLGAAYFIYLGIKSLLSKNTSKLQFEISKEDKLTSWGAFKIGLLCNVLNPKATMFFLGLFTMVINPQIPTWVQILYGLEMSLITFSWFTLLAVLITHKHVKKKLNEIQFYVTKFMGGLLMLFGIEIALLQRN